MIRRLSGLGIDGAREVDRETVIGRVDADVEIRHADVSRRHAILRPVPDGVEVEDLGSSNGTFIDGRRLTGKLTVSRSVTLRVGATELRLDIELPHVTVQRPIGGPGAPAGSPAPRPPQPPPQPAGPSPPAATGGASPPARPAEQPPSPHAQPVAPISGRGHRRRKDLAIAAGGLVLGVLLGAVLFLQLGASSKKPPSPRFTEVGCWAASCATTVKPHCPARLPQIIHDGFPEPQMLFARNGVLEASLRFSTADINVDGVIYTTGFEYDQQLPGPTLFICPGDKLILHLHNESPLETNLHVHGLHVSSDGSGDDVFIDVPPLTEHTYEYQIPLDQFPGFYWYHPHYHPRVEPEEAGGAVGAIVVEGSLDERLPHIPERLIVISGGNTRLKGQKLGTVASPAPTSFNGEGVPPPIGVPKLLVNGVVNPTLNIRPGQVQRWRILNATSDHLLNLEMPGVTFYLLAQDGVTLRYMLPRKQLLISPGSRVEVLVRGGPTGVYALSALPFRQCYKGCNPYAGPVTGVTSQEQRVITMISDGAVAHDRLPTGPIGEPPDLRKLHVDVHRRILFTQQPAGGDKAPAFDVNNQVFDPKRVDITMKLNSVEEWTLENPTNGKALEWHTFHIHQNPFQVTSIDGRPLDYIDWQDNVTLAPGETITILIHPIDFTGSFVFHCHVLFHEDNGMMATVQVVRDPPPAEVNRDRVLYLAPPVGKRVLADAHYSGAEGYPFWCGQLLSAVNN